MTLKRRLIRILDRRGWRALLAWLTTVYARFVLRRNVMIFHGTTWEHRTESQIYLPDGPVSRYGKDSLLALDDERHSHALRNSRLTTYGLRSRRPGCQSRAVHSMTPESSSIVFGTTWDAVCGELGIISIDFLKMNIEGATRLAIHGMERAIRHTTHVSFACHDFRADRGEGEYSRTLAEIVAFLKKNNFEVVLRQDAREPYGRDHVHDVKVVEHLRWKTQ